MSILGKLIGGCSHRNTSRVFTIPSPRRRGKRTYIVCLDCGKEFAYSLAEMRIVKRSKVESLPKRLAGVH